MASAGSGPARLVSGKASYLGQGQGLRSPVAAVRSYDGGTVEYPAELGIPKAYSASPVTYATAPMTYAGAPPMIETLEVVRGPGGQEQVREVIQPAMTYMGAPPTMTYAGAPPMVETLEVVRGPGGQEQVREVIQPAVTYMGVPPTVTYPGQRLEAVEVIRGPGGREQIVEIVRDESEAIALRTELEEKSILVAEYQRRNGELQAMKADLERRLGETDEQIAQARAERDRLQEMIEENQETINQQQAEIDMLLARNGELAGINEEQDQRIGALDNLVQDLEVKNSQQLTEINALRKCNQELEQLVAQQQAKMAELDDLIQDLRTRSVEPVHEEVHDNLSDEDKIDHRIKEFFRDHPDYQVSINKERAGLYTFAKPISKKVNMKVVGDHEVLARVGGGWEEVWSWLGSERQKFLEAEGILDADNTAAKKGRTSRSLGSRTSVQKQKSGR